MTFQPEPDPWGFEEAPVPTFAEILQPERGVRPAQELAHVDDDQSGEWGAALWHGCHVSVLPTQSAGLRYFTVCRCSQ